jgi:hypothetical protein
MRNLIKIGSVSVGLHGLDGALAELARKYGKDGISHREAATKLLERLEKRNYIPDAARHKYLAALEAAWRNKISGKDDTANNQKVRIMGKGCVGCNRLEQMVMEIFQELNIAADIEHIHELDEIYETVIDSLLLYQQIK